VGGKLAYVLWWCNRCNRVTAKPKTLFCKAWDLSPVTGGYSGYKRRSLLGNPGTRPAYRTMYRAFAEFEREPTEVGHLRKAKGLAGKHGETVAKRGQSPQGKGDSPLFATVSEKSAPVACGPCGPAV
jgi:hypothetical protein